MTEHIKMSEILEQEQEKTEDFDFSEVELAVRRWAAQTGHDNDQSWYQKMKEMYE
jgi:hypothetical protein